MFLGQIFNCFRKQGSAISNSIFQKFNKKKKYAKYMCQKKKLYFAFLKSPKQHGREHSENFLKESRHFEEENYEIIKL
jgi:hypothetical protein